MNRRLFAIAPVALIIAAGTTGAVEPPVAAKRPRVTVTHGDTLRDDYHWLREKQNPEVIAHLEAENAYCAAVMEPTRALQETLFQEMKGRLQETDSEPAYRRGGHFYYTRTEEGKQYKTYCRKRGTLDAPEEITLDVNRMAEGLEFLAIGDYEVSDDGHLLAYSTDTTGFRQYQLHVKDLRSGEHLTDTAERVTAIAWAADNRTLFYVQEDPVTKRWHRVYRYVLGSNQHELVYEEQDELYDAWAYRTRSGRFVILASGSSTTSEAWFIPADQPASAPVAIAPRREGHEYYVDHTGERFLIRTNDRGRNFRVVAAPVTSPSETMWKELVAHRDDVMLEDVDCFAGHVVVWEREDGLARLRVASLATDNWRTIDMPEPAYTLESSSNHVFDTVAYRFVYESFTTPSSVYDYDMTTRKRTLVKRDPVLGGYDPKHYTSERLYATAGDGTKIPISIVYRSDGAFGKRPKNRPMVLLGYGSYGISMDAFFLSERVSLLDRGVVFGIAHVRGGGEMGKRWHDDGKLMRKKNSFTDYIDCSEYLIEKGITAKDRLLATGRSAGGLLMGAVVTMRPDLFKAVFTEVPFVDVMNTMMDPTLPLTTQEYLEWGDPGDEDAYYYMKSYSPYDNVKPVAYPAMLVRTSLNDSQVMYFEPAKWVAQLRAHMSGGGPVLFRTRLESGGHSGASGRYDRLHDVAYNYAFMLWQLGITK